MVSRLSKARTIFKALTNPKLETHNIIDTPNPQNSKSLNPGCWERNAHHSLSVTPVEPHGQARGNT